MFFWFVENLKKPTGSDWTGLFWLDDPGPFLSSDRSSGAELEYLRTESLKDNKKENEELKRRSPSIGSLRNSSEHQRTRVNTRSFVTFWQTTVFVMMHVFDFDWFDCLWTQPPVPPPRPGTTVLPLCIWSPLKIHSTSRAGGGALSQLLYCRLWLTRTVSVCHIHLHLQLHWHCTTAQRNDWTDCNCHLNNAVLTFKVVVDQ